jgi:hypothetical protein
LTSILSSTSRVTFFSLTTNVHDHRDNTAMTIDHQTYHVIHSAPTLEDRNDTLAKGHRVFSGILYQIGAILVHEGPNLGMQIIPGKHAHPMDLICAGEFSGIFVAVFHESRKIRGQILSFSSAANFFAVS